MYICIYVCMCMSAVQFGYMGWVGALVPRGISAWISPLAASCISTSRREASWGALRSSNLAAACHSTWAQDWYFHGSIHSIMVFPYVSTEERCAKTCGCPNKLKASCCCCIFCQLQPCMFHDVSMFEVDGLNNHNHQLRQRLPLPACPPRTAWRVATTMPLGILR